VPLDGSMNLDVRQDTPAGTGTGGADGSSTSVPDAANPNGAAEGQPCTSANQCKSGYCFDGVCCQTDCSGVCLTCASADAVGTCVAADPGTDPRNECPDHGIASCGRDGACSGAGSCLLYPAGMTCRSQTCTGATLTQASRCDGQGACVPASGLPCTPFACGTDGTCLTTCTTDAQCSSGNVCTARS